MCLGMMEARPAPTPQSGSRLYDVFGSSQGFTVTCRAFHFYLNKPQADVFTLKLCCKGTPFGECTQAFLHPYLATCAVEGK